MTPPEPIEKDWSGNFAQRPSTARKLARIVHIDALSAIEGADAIELAHVGGWRVVVKKNEFHPGALAIYFEIDSFLPEGNSAWQFLVDKSARSFNALRGHVLRSVKLRGQVSQGLLLGTSALQGTPLSDAALAPGMNVSDALGVIKYDPPLPACLSGIALGAFPSRVPKTDQERIQNLTAELVDWQADKALHWEVTEKLEGTSCTFAWLDGVLHVCSRTLDLADTPGNSLWMAAHALGMPDKLKSLGSRNLALQGELVGHGIQGNIYGLKSQQFFLYDIYDVDAARYCSSAERQGLSEKLGVPHVPVLDTAFTLSPAMGTEALLAMADGASVLKKDQRREGLVFKALDGKASFKAISNQYLLKQKE